MKNTRFFLVPLLVVPMIALASGAVLAQPAVNPAVTDAQKRAEERAAHRADRIKNQRLMLGIYDIEDQQMQDAIIAFLTQEAGRREDVRVAKDNLQSVMRQKLASDAQVAQALTNFRAVVAASKDNYNKDLLELDQKTGYSKNPRLESTLVLLGIIGDEKDYSYGPSGFGIYAEPAKQDGAK